MHTIIIYVITGTMSKQHTNRSEKFFIRNKNKKKTVCQFCAQAKEQKNEQEEDLSVAQVVCDTRCVLSLDVSASSCVFFA